MSAMEVSGPPYLLPTAGIGGLPTVGVDDPICAVLLVLYMVAAAANMTIFQVTRKRDHKFIFSAMLFGFCMARITALVMRIVWASRPHNVSVAIAANILVTAGVLLLFIVNLIFAQSMVRAYHPHIGWHPAAGWFFTFLYSCVVAMLVMVITVTVQSFYTLNTHIRSIDHDIQLVAVTYLAVLAFLPIPMIAICLLAPRRVRIETFDAGRFRTKIRLLLFTSTLLSLGASFRAGAAYIIVPAAHPRWFDNKAAFYCFNFAIELIVVYTYTITRFDRRFHVPDGASAPGHYAGDAGAPAGAPAGPARKPSFVDRVNTEIDAFGPDIRGPNPDDEDDDQPDERRTDASRWEERARNELEKEANGEAV